METGSHMSVSRVSYRTVWSYLLILRHVEWETKLFLLERLMGVKSSRRNEFLMEKRLKDCSVRRTKELINWEQSS